MHSKATVWYICEEYVNAGRKFYWKRELLTTDSYRNLDSVYWSDRRPITRRTFERAQREGYKCDLVRIYHPPGDIILLEGRGRGGRDGQSNAHQPAQRRGNNVVRLLRYRLRKSMDMR